MPLRTQGGRAAAIDGAALRARRPPRNGNEERGEDEERDEREADETRDADMRISFGHACRPGEAAPRHAGGGTWTAARHAPMTSRGNVRASVRASDPRAPVASLH